MMRISEKRSESFTDSELVQQVAIATGPQKILKRLVFSSSNLTVFFAIIFLAFTTTPSKAQFSNGGGLFDNILNQALPRVSNPSNQYPAGSWPAQSNIPGINTGVVNPNASGYTSGTTSSLWPGLVNPAQAGKDWKLGVSVDSLDTGAIVRQVSPNSPAQRAGIEPNDIIVTIGGFQVGYVENRLNDVGEQIRRAADRSGQVRALVMDGRTARLENVLIQLDSASNAVTGSVALRDRGSLPYNSILTVQLENITRPYYEVRNGRVIVPAYGAGPFPFEIQYDPQYIDANDRYQLNAVITDSSNRTLYALRQPIPIPSGGLPQNSVLALENIRDLQAATQNSGGTITSGYGQDPAILNQVFQQLLGRLPSSSEQFAWSGYLAQGNSLNDLKAKILGSPNYYDRLGNNPQLFIQTMIRALSGRDATPNEVNAWLGRLQQFQGNREQVASEFINRSR